MLTAVMTWMPWSSSSSTSSYRFSCRLPGTLVCASSSTTATWGIARQHAVEVHLLEHDAAILDLPLGDDSRSPSWASVSLRPYVSTRATTTSRPWVRSWCASRIMRYVLRAWRRADVHAEPRAVLGLDLGEQVVGRRLPGRVHASSTGGQTPPAQALTDFLCLYASVTRAAVRSVMTSSNQSSYSV